jgi:glycine cleavage system H protein
MNVPAELLYTKEHEWIRMEGQTAVIGITDHAQDRMGDIVFVELPATGTHIAAAAPLANLESVKAVSEVFMPQSGTVEAVNTALEAAPESLNTDPYGSWIARVAFDAPLLQDTYLDAAAYTAFCAEE